MFFCSVCLGREPVNDLIITCLLYDIRLWLTIRCGSSEDRSHPLPWQQMCSIPIQASLAHLGPRESRGPHATLLRTSSSLQAKPTSSRKGPYSDLNGSWAHVQDYVLELHIPKYEHDNVIIKHSIWSQVFSSDCKTFEFLQGTEVSYLIGNSDSSYQQSKKPLTLAVAL